MRQKSNLQILNVSYKKKRLFAGIITSLYVFIILGFILHTSAHPQIFHKYTLKYFYSLLIFILATPIISVSLYKKCSKFSRKTTVIIILLIILIPLSISEIYLRWKYRNFESTSYTSTIDNFHPFLQSQPTKTDDLHINSLGFREDEIQQKKPEATFRIAVLGGSTVLNREVVFEKNATRLLEKKLRAYYPNKKIEVVNGGESGYTTEHSLIEYMFNVKDLNPDLVIMWAGINDMWASCTYKGLNHGNYKSDYSHALGITANIVFKYFRPQPLIQVKLVTWDFLFKALGDNFFSDVTLKVQAKIVEHRAQEYLGKKNTINVHYFPSLDAFKRNISYLINLTKQENVPLILGNQPNLLIEKPTVRETEKIMFPYQVCVKNDKYYDLESLHYGITLFNDTMKNVALNNDIEFVDLDNKIPKNLSYFTDNVHYTEKGNEVIAQTLFEKIINEGLIR